MSLTLGSITDVVNAQLSRNQFNSVDSIALITQKLVERHKEERADIAINFERADLIRATKKIADMVSFKQKIADNVIATAKAAEAINWVKNYLGQAKTELNKILGSTSNEDRAAAAASVNGLISDINSKVNGANQTTGFTNLNLVGNTKGPDWKTDDIFSPTSDSGPGFVQIEGAFLGVDFQVTDLDGFNWRLDTTDNTFDQYKSDGSGQRTGKLISAEGLTIDSYDTSTGAITYGGTGSLTGTLKRAGLELLTSEYYNNFADDTSVQNAINDIDNAVTITNKKGSSILADATLLEARIKLINSKIQNLEDEKLRIKAEELAASSAKTKAADVKVQLALNNINLLSQVGSGLIENMMTLSAGPSKALGVFGLLGY